MIKASRSQRLLAGTGGLLLATGAFAPVIHAATDDLEEIPVLEEIIVTAEKRETNLQKTPQTINVITARQLAEASITTVNDLQTMVAGLNVQTGGGFSGSGNDITIRGVQGQTGGDPSIQPSVASLIDGVYSQSSVGQGGSLFDMAQVEVIKGPQGTLYGRNATTGVISYTTQKPKLGVNEGKISTDIGNYSKVNASGVLNVPIGDRFAVRLAGQSSKHDGYYKDGYSNEDTQGGRVRMLLKPTNDLELSLSADYELQKGKGSGATSLVSATGEPLGGDAWAGPTSSGWVTANNKANYRGKYGQDAAVHNTNWGVSPQIEWTIGDMLSTTNLSFKQSVRDEVDAAFGGTYVKSKEKQIESRLQSTLPDARLKWQVGVNYYEQDLTGVNLSVNGLSSTATGSVTSGGRPEDYDFSKVDAASTCTPFSPPNFTNCYAATITRGRKNTETNYALFTQETFAVTKAIRLTGGARWQYEKAGRSSTTTYNYIKDPVSGFVPDPGTPSSTGPGGGAKHWTAITWKAGIDMDVAENSMAYAMVSTGWKAGTPQEYDAPYDQQKPEKLTAYTLGIKNRFLEQRLQVNAEYFYWDYKDRQVSIVEAPGTVMLNGQPAPGLAFLGGQVFVQGNADKAHSQGISLETSFRPVLSDFLSANIEYLYQSIYDDMGPGNVSNGCSEKCRTANSPKISATLSYRHTFDMGDDGRINFDFNGKYETEQVLNAAKSADDLRAQGLGALVQKSYLLSNAGLSYSPKSSKWNMRGYVNNIEDKMIKTFASTGFPGSGSPATGTLLAPRTYGVQLSADF